MNNEIELKLCVHTDQLPALRAAIQALYGEAQPARSLVSTYYDTENQLLRQHDIGLRVRQNQDDVEMTIKLAGRVTGGLHQRPEYTVTLPHRSTDSEPPDLSLFPADIWPVGVQISELQAALQPLFITRFQREICQIQQADSRIELALDQGIVSAGEQQETLCELELELLAGDTADVLALAQTLASQIPGLRHSGLSKAARGYHLALGEESYPLLPLSLLRLPPKSSIEQGFIASLEWALAHWLYHEEVWLRCHDEDSDQNHKKQVGRPEAMLQDHQPDNDTATEHSPEQENHATGHEENSLPTKQQQAKNEVRHAIDLLRHCLTLFNCIIPRKVTSELREMLADCNSRLTSDDSAEQVAYSPQNSMTRLALTRWLLVCGWQPLLDDSARGQLADSFKRFADIQLSRQAAELKRTFVRALHSRYQDQLPRLARGLDYVHILAGAYSETRVQSWLENWQLFRQAIIANQPTDIDRYRQLSVAQPPFWLHSGTATASHSRKPAIRQVAPATAEKNRNASINKHNTDAADNRSHTAANKKFSAASGKTAHNVSNKAVLTNSIPGSHTSTAPAGHRNEKPGRIKR